MKENSRIKTFFEAESMGHLQESINDYFQKILINIPAIFKTGVITLITIEILEVYDFFSIFSIASVPKSVYALVLIFFIFSFIELKLFSFLFLKIYNFLDSILIYCIFTLSVYLLFGLEYYLLTSILVSILIVLVVIETTRMLLIIIASYKTKASYKRFDLFDLLDKSDLATESKYTLIADSPSNQDLLNREFIISNLYDSIVSSSTEEKFVISLEGGWGSGKTTIINIVKGLILNNYSDNIIIIDDFDPWIFNDKSTMLLDMFDRILSKTSIRSSYFSVNMFLGVIKDVIFSTKIGQSSKFLGSFSNLRTSNIDRVRRDIDDYLSISGKKVVFFLDNIDRAEKENIKLLFKLIHSDLGFNKIIYVLAFDEKIVCDLLDEEYYDGKEFLKKLIQMQIKIPAIDSLIMNELIKRTTINLISSYGYSEEIEDSIGQINFYPNLIGNVRDLIRFLNSIITSNFRTGSYLNLIDTLGIELIKNENNELYTKIYNNSRYYISHDISYESDMFMIVDKRKYNDDAKSHFDSLFSSENNKKYKNLLSIMFPNIRKFFNNEDIINETQFFVAETRNEKHERSKNRRIFSGKFFSLYFTNMRNAYSYIQDEIERILKETTSKNSYSLANELRNFLFEKNNEHQTILKLETLNYYVDDISLIQTEQILAVLIDDYYSFDYQGQFFSLNCKERASVLMTELLLKVDDANYSQYISQFVLKISNLEMIGQLYYWINSHYKSKGDMENPRLIQFREMLRDLGAQIMNKKLDIYSDENYRKDNIWGLYESLKITNEISKLPEYIAKVLNEDNVFRFLFSITSTERSSRGTNHYINKKTFEMFTTVELVDSLLENVNQTTEEEDLIKKIYIAYKAEEKDEWGHEVGLFAENFKPAL